MKTIIFSDREVDRAAELLCQGKLVGIPTETVYGLGANGLNPEAVSDIFTAKGRPQDNPLILHIADVEWLGRYCRNIPTVAYELAKNFWPGPLTMVLERNELVPDVVTAGLNTVGMRCPDHEICRAMIAACDLPIAAPSGNRSGKPSPTTAAHMLEDMEGRISGIVDGGSCTVGVESTIVDLTCTPPRLLRPGGVTLEQLRTILSDIQVDSAVVRPMKTGEKPRAPGMKYRHYAPEAPVTVVQGKPLDTARYLQEKNLENQGIICFNEYVQWFENCKVKSLGNENDQGEQARRVFDALRSFDGSDVTQIWAQCPEDHDIGLAVCNRLNKAAGFQIITVPVGADSK